MGGSYSGIKGNNTSTSTDVNTYGLYKIPYVSSAINVNTENLKKCLDNSITSVGNQLCIQNNVYAAVDKPSSESKLNVTFYGPGRTNSEQITTVTQNQFSKNPGSLLSKTVMTTSHEAPGYPTSGCYEKFESNNNETNYVNIESNNLFCFNSTFTILTIFTLILLLIFININSKKK